MQDSQNQTEEETATLLAGKAAQKHGDLLPWAQLGGVLRNFVSNCLVDSATVVWW